MPSGIGEKGVLTKVGHGHLDLRVDSLEPGAVLLESARVEQVGSLANLAEGLQAAHLDQFLFAQHFYVVQELFVGDSQVLNRFFKLLIDGVAWVHFKVKFTRI